MRLIIAIILILSFSTYNTKAQKTLLYNKHSQITKDKNNYAYKRVILQITDTSYLVEDFYPDNQKKSTGTYITDKVNYLKDYRGSIFRNDTFVYYHTNGQIQEKGSFSFGRRVGKWHSYYPNGILKSVCIYDTSSDIIKKKTSLYNENGVLTSDIEQNGLLFTSKKYTPDGQVIDKNETFSANGNMMHGEKEYSITMPQPKYDVYAYLRENISYPAIAKREKIQGRVIVKFIVNMDGYIIDVESTSLQTNKLLQIEAIRVVQQMPPWQPGLQNGKPVLTYYQLPVTFKL